jgi:hypothetical protein
LAGRSRGGEIEVFALVDARYTLLARFDCTARLRTLSFPELDVELARVFR